METLKITSIVPSEMSRPRHLVVKFLASCGDGVSSWASCPLWFMLSSDLSSGRAHPPRKQILRVDLSLARRSGKSLRLSHDHARDPLPPRRVVPPHIYREALANHQ